VPDFAHPSVDDLADLAEGLLPAERSGEVSGHLASCADCTRVAAALEEVQATLALAASSPEPIPESVSRTIDDALRRASAERAAGVTSLAERRDRPQVPLARQRPPRWAVIAGAAAAVVVVGYAGSSLLDNGGGTNSSADQGGSANAVAGGGAAGTGRTPSKAEGSSQPPGKAAEDVVTPKTLAGYATRLVAGRGYIGRSTNCGATVRAPAGASVATVRWKGRRAAVVADPSSHRVKVYNCGDSAILFSTTY
jgi:anti-sigma factor RsiW